MTFLWELDENIQNKLVLMERSPGTLSRPLRQAQGRLYGTLYGVQMVLWSRHARPRAMRRRAFREQESTVCRAEAGHSRECQSCSRSGAMGAVCLNVARDHGERNYTDDEDGQPEANTSKRIRLRHADIHHLRLSTGRSAMRLPARRQSDAPSF